MKPKFTPHYLDAELVFNRYLGTDDTLDKLLVCLEEIAPRWSSELFIHRIDSAKITLKKHNKEAFKKAVLGIANERGPLYRKLVDIHGTPPFERISGSTELRGAYSGLIVIIAIDEMIASPIGTKTALGNYIAIQVRNSRIENQDSAEWLRNSFKILCTTLAPVWGYAGCSEEYWSKVMTETPRVEAVGRDFGRYLPGVFWLNFFGRIYERKFGKTNLESIRAHNIISLEHGTLVELSSSPHHWNSTEYITQEQTLRNHLGSKFFFSKGRSQ